MAKYIPLKAAAKKIDRSVARVRQYVKDGKFGEEGTGWQRNEFGHILIDVELVAGFTAPERGNARASGIQSKTTLRHFRAAKAWLMKHMKESDRRAIWIEVTDRAIATLTDASKRETAELEAVEAVAPSAEVEVEVAGVVEAEVEETLDEDLDELVLDL